MINKIDNFCVNHIRAFGMDVIDKAKSGHPGIVLGAAPIVHTLYTRILNTTSLHPNYYNRDRFILSAGHGSMLLYTVLHLAGFPFSKEDLLSFRQLNSKCAGHPEHNVSLGIETTTGPLGQGIANAVGLAVASKHLQSKYNKDDLKVVDNYIYALCGDGDLQEGVALEAISFAGHNKLDNLIILFDSNDIQLDGATNLTVSEDVKKKFESMNWAYLKVEDGNDCDAIANAILEAKKQTRPVLIEIKTIIGHGVWQELVMFTELQSV
jgi:transketolase